jgi:hypothetical protein
VLNPFTKSVECGAFLGKFFWESGPLCSGAGHVDDAVKDGSVWVSWTTRFFAGFVDEEFGLDALPEVVWDGPDGGLLVDLGLVDLGGAHAFSLASLSTFRIGPKEEREK